MQPTALRGTLLCVPIVKCYASRALAHLPDRRDLNRSFWIGERLAGRPARAHLMSKSFGAELWRDPYGCGPSGHLPQIRADLSSARVSCPATPSVFRLCWNRRTDGSLGSGRARGRRCLVKGGEGLRFDEFAIKAAVEASAGHGVAGMMELGGDIEQAPAEMRRGPVFADASKWVRAPDGGVFRSARRIGHAVSDGDLLGCVANPYDESEVEVRAPCRGIIIGATTLPIVNMGDALFHIAWTREHQRQRQRAAGRRPPIGVRPVMDEDEII